MEGQGRFGNLVEKSRPYIAMISLQFGYAGMNIVTKVSLDRGMSHYVLVVYRNAFAFVVIAPFALFLERKVRTKVTFPIFMHMFVLALLGPVIDQNLYYAGLKFTSPTFSCSMSNMLPAMTFVIAVLCRMEKLNMKKLTCLAKVFGTVVTVCGAILMTLYKGQVINFFWSNLVHLQQSPGSEISGSSDKDWIKGSIFLIIATLSWAGFFILQAITLRKYQAQLSLIAIVCGLGTLQSIAVTFLMEHRPSVWAIGFDMNLLAAAYAGIVSSSMAYYVQGKVVQRTGPIFLTAFSPLTMILVAIMGSFILAEKIYLGGILGGVVIVMGLYVVLWGKYKEHKEEDEFIMVDEPIKVCDHHIIHTLTSIREESSHDIEMQRTDIATYKEPAQSH
ncbi:WAT1-related protein At5g07050-like [Rutidosis leptorrhynchoides]|uniref:WAT1-related protein At5g07050-like n=1 Tax=Rutidosis leptorrhynchoides TaxID=125765 RepID=UPI003A995FEA